MKSLNPLLKATAKATAYAALIAALMMVSGCTRVEEVITNLGRSVIGTITLIGSVTAGIVVVVLGVLIIVSAAQSQSSSAVRYILGFGMIFGGIATVIFGPGLIYDTMVSLAKDAPPVQFYKPQ